MGIQRNTRKYADNRTELDQIEKEKRGLTWGKNLQHYSFQIDGWIDID